jgi:murein DD-endopeptidase MepM/ murein hydrolase activator NlpD
MSAVIGILRIPLLPALVTVTLAACSTVSNSVDGSPTPSGTEAPTPTPPLHTLTATAVATPTSPSRTATATAMATLTPAPPTPSVHPGPAEEPLGFPIDPDMKLGLVVGTAGSRTIDWGAGLEAGAFTRNDQPSDDAERANGSGWNCRVHVEYEGQSAVDWYIPVGTPVMATMDGTATLYVVTVTNAFDHYGVEREPYLGDPDRTRASLWPFPGPSGGKGVFVRIENSEFVTDYAHLDLAQTVPVLSVAAFLPGYGPDSDYATAFAPLRDFRTSTPIAEWTVERGDLIGLSGDSGYSEAPHLHYTVRRGGSSSLLCPTAEAGFEDGGWLVK